MIRQGARFLIVVCLFAMGAQVFAKTDAAQTPADAKAYIESLASQVFGVMNNKAMNKPQKQKQLEQLFVDHVDVAWIGRSVLGRFWRTAEQPQRDAYLREYRSFLTQNYAGRFAEYSGGSFTITDARAGDEDGQFVVSMSLTTGEGQQVSLDYRLHTTDGKLQVFDVIVEGVSLITTQRSEFAAVLNNKGVDYLTDQLKNRTLETKIAEIPAKKE